VSVVVAEIPLQDIAARVVIRDEEVDIWEPRTGPRYGFWKRRGPKARIGGLYRRMIQLIGDDLGDRNQGQDCGGDTQYESEIDQGAPGSDNTEGPEDEQRHPEKR